MTIINNIEIDNIRYNENDIKKAIKNNDPIEDKLHVIIVISNPCNFAIRYILTKEFIRRMKDEDNIILYIVELAYENKEFYITDKDNSRHLRLRTNSSPIWLKENMINIGIKKLLPENWKAVAWIDADIEFDSPNWALDTLKILNGCKDVVQLFSHNIFMDKNGDTELILSGFGFQYIKKTKRSNRIKDINSYWHPGFAWACTRKFYEKIGGLYEYAITGDGDMQMASCFIQNYKSALPQDVSENYKKTLEEFENKVFGCRIGYVPGIIRHHYHGSINSRKYDMREQILTKYDYSPTIYLTKDDNGLLIPTNKFPSELMECIMNHFQLKNEDESIIKNDSNKILLEYKKNINIRDILEKLFNKSVSTNCILINLKKDINRLYSSKEELKKISIKDGQFMQLEATYWKNTNRFEKDLNEIFIFLSKYNNNINIKNINVNEFSETNDQNIKIQDGLLACFCSHIRAMIHGYLNFSDYTIIVEDDISIDSIINIEKYIKLIPPDWDIIVLGAEHKNLLSKDPYYKLHSTFFHLHFYIIKNTCMETIFKNIYPIFDQIDILIGNMWDKLNIYNIIQTVSQKKFITNIQNNLNTLKNSKDMIIFENLLEEYVNEYLPDNDIINKNITRKILDDVIYNNIFNNLDNRFSINTNINNNNINKNNLYIHIEKILKYFVRDNDTTIFITELINEIDYILSSFKLHNKLDDKYNEKLKAYNFGSTSSVYLLKNSKIIIKVYNDKLRWNHKDHTNIFNIFNKEIIMLQDLDNYLIECDKNNLTIKMNYKGESLYNNFILPNNWKEQIVNIFDIFTKKNINYSEFNLNNILLLNEKITFIDFGLANNLLDNYNNCNIFTELLEILNKKYQNITDQKEKQVLYNIFINNMKNNNRYSNNIY
jgi:hypothetical protein